MARAVPPNTHSMLDYHSAFKGALPRHRDLKLIQGEHNGDQTLLRGAPIINLSLFAPMQVHILRGVPIMTLSIFALMQFHIWAPENKKKEEVSAYEFQAENHYTKEVGMHVLEPKSLSIWHPGDDKRYMHSLDFPPELPKNNKITYCRLSYIWRWSHNQGTYFTSGPNDGNAILYFKVIQYWNLMHPLG
jgi:hypothetical protein